jgi:hypothetical protein
VSLRLARLISWEVVQDQAGSLYMLALGTTNSSAWGHPRLVKWDYTEVPSDRIESVEFIMSRVEGPDLLTPVYLGVAIQLEGDVNNYWGKGIALAGVRIHVRSGSATFKFEEELRVIERLPD